MTFHEQLARETAADRAFLLSAPVIQRCLAGDVTRPLYVAFLTQAYHHVRHTVPLLMAVGSRLPDRHAWLRDAVLHYLEEETGHDEWILNDIERAGGGRLEGDRRAVDKLRRKGLEALDVRFDAVLAQPRWRPLNGVSLRLKYPGGLPAGTASC